MNLEVLLLCLHAKRSVIGDVLLNLGSESQIMRFFS